MMTVSALQFDVQPIMFSLILLTALSVEFAVPTYIVIENEPFVEVCVQRNGLTDSDIEVTVSAMEEIPPSAQSKSFACHNNAIYNVHVSMPHVIYTRWR